MNIENFITKLKKLDACKDSTRWLSAQDNLEQAWEDCERGDWLLWLVARLEINERKLFLAKGLVAKQVLHLMKDKRSINAVKAAIDYGNGKIEKDELKIAAYAAIAAAYTTAGYAAVYAAANANAVVAVNAVNATANAIAAANADAADGAATAATDADNAAQLSLKKSADIAREVFAFEEIIEALCGELK